MPNPQSNQIIGQLRQVLTRLRQIAPERYLLLGLLLVAVGLWVFALRSLPRPLEVTAFAVDDGDAFLIRAPSGRTVLLDGGSRDITEVGERVLLPNLLLLGVRRLDAIIVTHPDSDHLNGLPAVMEAMPVGMLLEPELPGDTTAYQQLLESARQHNIPHYRATAGERLNLGGGVHMNLLAPADTRLSGTPADDNNNSVVCLLSYRQARMLFTGDLQEEGEQALLAQARDLRAQVLKVAHHGSMHGSCDAFLTAVQPSLALISSSGSASHPHPAVLDRLRARGVQVLRTDVLGETTLRTDGAGWQVRSYRNPPR
ncbi:MAG: ComEC/Rec2 family competence protein [Armatimonadota bacterium]